MGTQNYLKTTILNDFSIGSWNEFSDYCPVCKKFLGEDFPYDIKLLYKEPGHKQTYEAIDQLLQKNKDCQRRIESSEGLLSKIKILHEIHEELEYFFTGQKNDDD